MEKYSQIIFDNRYTPLFIYYLAINLIGFIMMGKDKRAAKKNRWRIKEKSLFIISFIGGCIGCLFGMKVFRHKTQKIIFYVVFWGSLILHILGLIYLFVF